MCVVACMFTIMPHYRDVPIVMYDCDFQGAHCMKFNQWLISPCTRGMTVGRLSVCFSSPSPFTGNFHVVNGGIDSRSLLFVLHSVYHLRRKQERKLAEVWLHGRMWSMAPTWHAVLRGMSVTHLWFDLNSTLLYWFSLSKYTVVLHSQKHFFPSCCFIQVLVAKRDRSLWLCLNTCLHI